MDWNWFFSSVAQSTAAILAVFSAFIITKIINNQSQFEANKRRIKSALNESKKFKELVTYRRVGWYSQYLINRETRRLEKKCKSGEKPRSAEEYYFITPGFPIFIKRDRIIERIQSVMNLPVIASKEPNFSTALADFKTVQDMSEEQMIREEQNDIYTLIAEVKHHVSLLSDLIEELQANNEYSPVLKWSIIASMSLFFIGVIYPLGFLPMPQPMTMLDLSIRHIPACIFSFNGALLFVFALIFTGINLYFLKINSRMVYDQASINELKAYSVFGDYHGYFQNMEDNQKARSEFIQKLEESVKQSEEQQQE